MPVQAHRSRSLVRPAPRVRALRLPAVPAALVVAVVRERWRKIPGWPHQVSDRGRIRSLPRTLPSGQALGGDVLAQTRDRDGYWTVHLRHRGHEWRVPVHVLVATHFPCFTGLEVRHLNGKDDNSWLALRWGTHRENMQDEYEKWAGRSLTTESGGTRGNEEGRKGIDGETEQVVSPPFPSVALVSGDLQG